jgi:hypothetical protein
MLKKILLVLGIAASIVNTANAQCTPDPAYADSSFGVWPDTLENLPCAFADEANGYNAVINIKTLGDSTFVLSGSGSVTAAIQKFRIISVTGLPTGFSYTPNTPEWINIGSDPNYTPVQGCVSVTASQSSIQSLLASNPTGVDYNLTINVDAFITSTDNFIANIAIGSNGRWLSDPALATLGVSAIPVTGYKIRVRGVSGDCGPLSIGDAVTNAFSVKGNYPNPFNRSTKITYNVTRSQYVELAIYNMVGNLVMKQNIPSIIGENTYEVSANQLKSGVYFYTLSDGKKTITKRMSVSNN